MGWELEIGDVGWGPVSSMEEAATGTKREMRLLSDALLE